MRNKLLIFLLFAITVPAPARSEDDKERRLYANAQSCLLEQLHIRADDPRCFSNWTIRMEVWDKACKGPIGIYFNYKRDVAKDTPEMLKALWASWFEYWNDYMDKETYKIQKRNGCF